MTETHIGEVEAIKALVQNQDFTDARQRAAALLEQEPDNLDGLYLLAVSHRYLKQYDEALQVLQKLVALAPNYGRAWQERGHNHRELKQLAPAIEAYTRAARCNRALISSWQNLALLYKMSGNEEHAAQCLAEFKRLASQPQELVAVESMLIEGKLYLAEQQCRQYLQSHPDNLQGMRLLAKIGDELDILSDADFLLETALQMAPEYDEARYDHALVLLKLHRPEAALGHAEKLLAKHPGNHGFRLLRANANAELGRLEVALEEYAALISEAPGNSRQHLLLGNARKTAGDFDGAVQAYRDAIELEPDLGDAWWSLANLKTYHFDDAALAQMMTLEQTPGINEQNKEQICFALGKGLEDKGEFESAFDYYRRGNALNLTRSQYQADKTDAEMRRQAEVCNKRFFDERLDYGLESSEPIFIVGLPRAGSTLIEQILASHSQIDGTIELPNILSLVQKLNGRQKKGETGEYPEVLQSLTAEQIAGFAQDYLQSTRVYRTGAPLFTDKMPNNFRHIGLLQLMFPKARIIDARRHPLACCFSGFKQWFGSGQNFSYGLEEIGRYYRSYVELMRHWDRVLPGKILRVLHEDVVEDLETQVRRMLDFLELPFEEACLDFHRNQRAVHTPSAEQVRQPIIAAATQQWKPFEPWLQPLKTALGPALEHYQP